MPSRLDAAIRDALPPAVPAVSLAAIHRRERAIARRSAWSRSVLVLAIALLGFAGIAVATAGRPAAGVPHAPVPVASLHPTPIIT